MPSVGYATLQVIPSVRGIGDDLRRQLVGPAGDAGQRAGDAAGDGLGKKLAVGAAAAGIGAGALLVAGITEAMDQANITSTLQAQLGTTGAVAAKQGKLAGKLYSSGVSGSFQEAADAIRAVVQSGLAPPDATNKQLQAIATKASDVANVFGQDLGGVTNAVSQLMRTGLAKNSTQAFDLITRGFQSGADKAGDFLDTINEYGTQFRKAGLDGVTATGLINQGLKAGARDADLVADSIKEFSIRAIDGSTSTKDGFKALGLSADDMAAKFGKGGKTSKAALDLTLDRLRGIKDPVKQAEAATALFGTQAEDLGDALFALDPSTAAKGLGDVGGAADKMGKAIRSGPSHEIAVFKRALQQGFVEFLGGKVLPIITEAAIWFNKHLLPPIKAVASVVAASLGPALRGLGSALSGTVNWLREWGVWLAPIAILIGGVVLALSAQAIATAAVTAAFAIYRAVILIGTAVTSGFTAAQAALNAVLALNPITLIVIALVALGAALFIAYKKSDTFRAIVQAAWAGIKTAALVAWNAVLKPVISALGTAVTWLWQTIIKPYFTLMIAYWRRVGAIAMWLWHEVLSPVVSGIVALFKIWWAGVKLYVGFVIAVVRAVGRVFVWLWRERIAPILRAIVAGAKLWWTGVKTYFRFVRDYIIGPLARTFRWLWSNIVKPVFNGIKATISTVWRDGIKPVFNALKSAVRAVGTAFERAKDAIKKAWDKLRGIAKAPVSFIINTVYNKGIVGVWNKVAGAFGAPKLSKFHFAEGGVLPGYTPGRDVHLAALSGGEAVMRPEWTRAVGPGYVNSMNAAARSGGVAGVQKSLGLPGFADGGIFGWVKGAASKGVDLAKAGASWLKDGIKASALAGINKIVRPMLDRISGSASRYRDMISGIPERMIRSMVDFSGKADKKLNALGVGGRGTQAALKWARTQNGKRYQWGGNGNPSWDCSGFMSAIESVIRGQRPHRRWSTHAFQGGAPPGWQRGLKAPFMIGITHSGVGHTAGTLNRVNVESRGGDGVVVGNRARGYNNGLFPSWYGFRPSQKFDSGGWLMPGHTAAYNGTGQPERVLTAPQWRIAENAMAAAGGERVLAGDLYLDSGEFLGKVRGVVRSEQRQLAGVLRAGRKR